MELVLPILFGLFAAALTLRGAGRFVRRRAPVVVGRRPAVEERTRAANGAGDRTRARR